MEIYDNQKKSSINCQDEDEFLEERIIYKTYTQRWFVLFAFCSFTFTSSMAFVQYSPIIQLASEYYSVSSENIVWMSTCYYIAYFYFSPFGIKPLEKRMDISLILASLLTALGGWLKYSAHQNYAYALVGFMAIGLGQTCLLAAPAYLSDRWFAQHERTLATSIGSFLNYMGMNFALIYTSIKFDRPFVNIEEIKYEIDQMNYIFAIMSSCAFILCLLFIRNNPPTPPSYSSVAIKQSICKSYKQIFSKIESVTDLISISIFIGASWGYLVVISILLEPYNYTQKGIGYVSLCYSTTGTIGGTLASIYVDHQIKQNNQPNYDFFIKSFITIGFLGILLKAIIIDYVSDIFIIILSGIIGLGLNSFLPLAAQGFIEKMFPSFELVLMTAMMQTSNLFGFLINYLLVLEALKSSGLWFLLIILTPFYIYIILFYKTSYVRYNKEQDHIHIH